MLARLSAVVQDVCVVATGILKGIGKDGHSVEGFLFVDARLGAMLDYHVGKEIIRPAGLYNRLQLRNHHQSSFNWDRQGTLFGVHT